MNRSLIGLGVLSLLLCVSVISISSISTVAAQTNPSEGWAVLLEMNDYPSQWTDLETGYADTTKWNDTLTALGWENDHIEITRGYLSANILLDAIDFLVENADENDLAFFYVFAHGTWMDQRNFGGEEYLDAWGDIQSQKKLMVLSTCHSGDFIEDFENEDAPHIHISATDQGELGLAGEETEEVSGCLFNHFLTNAFSTDTADLNDDADVTVEEAFAYAYDHCREYIENEVFPEDSDLAQLFGNDPQHPQMDDAYEGQFSMLVEKAVEQQPIDMWLLIGGSVIIVVCVIVVILVVKRRA